MEEEKTCECGMPLDETSKCKCDEKICVHCCECPEDCKCNCAAKKDVADEAAEEPTDIE